MRYQFFICKPREKWDSLVSRTLRAYLVSGEYRIDREDLLMPFDVERLSKLLREASGEMSGFMPRFKFRQICGLPLLAVKTEYRKAQEVADALTKCLGEEGLSLFDGEMDCLTSISKDARASFVMVRLAHQRFRIAIRCKFNPEWTWYARVRVFKLGECHYGIGESISKQFSTIDTAISIMYGKLHSGVEELYKVLSETALGHGESVYCKNGCFVVENEDAEYRLRFVLEGRGKSPQEIGWMEDGVIKTEMVHRMGIYQTRRLIAKDGIGEEEYVRSRLYFDERFHTRGDWRNPADRFVDSYKISQRLKKQKLDIIYGRHPNRSHNEFVFCRCDEDGLGWDAWKTSSFFTMSEGQAAPLLAIFESVIPYYYEYYYDKFHFRKEEAEQILDRIKTVRLQIINDPCDPSLGKISQRLLNSHFAWEYPDDRKAVRFDEEERCEILSQNRFRVLALLDFFAWWLSEQRNSTSTFFDGFYVEGP